MNTVRTMRAALLLWTLLTLPACGFDHEYLDAVQISPAGGTATFGATNNTVQFTATGWYSLANYGGSGPPTLQQPNQHKVLTNAAWKTSDTTNTSIDAHGLATCTGQTSTPATITATANGGLTGSVSGTASLICN